MRNTGAGKFSRASYDANNQWGIDQLSSFIVSKGFEIIPKRGEDYGIDIAAIRAGEIVYLEAEVKTNYPWTCREDFKFPTVSFLARKKKWDHVTFWYVVICRETGAFVMCKSDDIFKEEYRTVKHINTQHRKGIDVTYNVPKEKCIFIWPKTLQSK